MRAFDGLVGEFKAPLALATVLVIGLLAALVSAWRFEHLTRIV